MQVVVGKRVDNAFLRSVTTPGLPDTIAHERQLVGNVAISVDGEAAAIRKSETNEVVR